MTAQPPDPLLDRVAAAVGDRYDVQREIGRGGMAVVYHAVEVRLQRPVALKVLPPDLAFRAGVRARFLREAQTAAQLSHPNVVPVFAAGDDGGVAWLAMALVDGETLAARVARPPRLAPGEAARVLAEVADALAYAHARGVVHRDVKPDNVLLDRHTGRVVVTDFGIARAAEEDERLTMTGAALGTPAYMSPEQAMGEGAVDGRSDQYALGVVGYQLLTGVLPFQASSATAMLMKHVGETPRPVRERAPEVPPALAAAVERALAKRPADRWPDAGAFRDAVRAAAGAGAAPAPLPAPAPRGGAPGHDGGGDWGGPWHGSPRERRDQLREERREQRERAREWGAYAREQARAQRDEWREAVRAGAVPPVPAPAPFPAQFPAPPNGPPFGAGYPPGGYPPIPLEHRASAFRRKAVGSFVLMAFLLVINASHLFLPPWFIFPWLGLASDLRRRWRPLGAAGLGFWDVMFDGAGAAARARGDAPARPVALIERDVRRLRRHAVIGAGAAAGAVLATLLGLATGADVFAALLIVFGFLAFAMLIGGVSAAGAVRRAGVPLRRALSDGWRDAVAAADPRPRAVVLDEEARALVGEQVLAGPYGPAVRDAVEDRRAVRDTVAALGPADRALLPMGDVVPTLDGLVGRVGELARRLDQVDRDAAPGSLDALDARLAAARADATTPDRERTLQLLERQRASLADLAARREALADRLESARLALRNLRLDFLKLRDEGVGAIAGAGSATQEARALSRELRHALEAAGEVREVGGGRG
jgi:serine/threonine-protein kinase